MQGPLAQMVALTCHGNLAIRDQQIPPFFPANSTCQFCEFAKFIAGGKLADGERQVQTIAETPDQWIQGLRRRSISGLRLRQRARNDPKISDRLSSGFVGGGKQWRIEGIRGNGTSEFWLDKWEVGNRDSPDRRIWRVTYGLCEVSATEPFATRTLEEIASELRTSLTKTRAFSEAKNCGGFTQCFDDALRALNEPRADVGYHKDLFPEGSLSDLAASVLKAAQAAWVFGGMGSWNDMGFDGEAQTEYARLSDKLFDVLNEAIEAAATSSMTPKNQ